LWIDSSEHATLHNEPKMKKELIALLMLAALFPLAAEGKHARCVIKQDGATAFSGSCNFQMGAGGSFGIRRLDAKPILPNITDISVSIISPGVADVRGLTTDGINSRWGTALRSKVDPACWKGSDFEICAY
jgi:hypothetical protein